MLKQEKTSRQNLDRQRQIAAIKNYLEQSEKKQTLLGAELEYFIVDKNSKRSISYYEANGIESLLQALVRLGFSPDAVAGHLLGVHNESLAITLEPGAQWEISLHPQANLEQLKQVFCDFLEILQPLLKQRGQELCSTGYLPASKISQVPIIPKNRYKLMHEYLSQTGKLAHNMMRGTASIQVAVDYHSETDFVEKMRLACRLVPIFSAIYDNSNIFEAAEYRQYCLRTKIWNNCDDDRCGVLPIIFEPDFGYAKYAEYILQLVPILIKNQQSELPFQKPFAAIFDLQQDVAQQLDHIFSMCFPDVRARNYIELRMTDALPYPLSFAFIELVELIFNNQNNFRKVAHLLAKIDFSEINQAKHNIIQYGIKAEYAGKSILEHFRAIMQLISGRQLFQKHNYQIAASGIIPRDMKAEGGKIVE